MEDYMINSGIPNKFLKEDTYYPSFTKNIGIVTSLNDLMSGKKMSYKIEWIIGSNYLETDKFKNNKNRKITFFCECFEPLFNDLLREGFNVVRARNDWNKSL